MRPISMEITDMAVVKVAKAAVALQVSAPQPVHLLLYKAKCTIHKAAKDILKGFIQSILKDTLKPILKGTLKDIPNLILKGILKDIIKDTNLATHKDNTNHILKALINSTNLNMM